MLKILLVDDELMIRRGIETSIDWNSYSIEFNEASNGQEALEKALKLKPHIIITDIRMPVMDGLKLCSSLRKENVNSKIVILSGYDDFSYAQEAIKYNVSNYLLKPFGAEELLKTILELKDDIYTEEKLKEKKETEKLILDENLNLIRARFFNNLLKNHPNDKELTLKSAKALGLSLDGPMYQILLVKIDNYYLITEDLSPSAVSNFRNTVRTVIESSLNNNNFVFECDFDYFIVLLNIKSHHRDIPLEVIEKINSEIKQELQISTTVCIGNIYSSLDELHKSYEEARLALKQKIHFSRNSIIKYSEKFSLVDDRPIIYPSGEEKKLLECIHSMNLKGIDESIHRIYEPFKDSEINYNIIQTITIRILTIVINLAEDMGVSVNDINFNLSNFYKEILKYETMDELKSWLISSINHILDLINKNKSQNYKSIIIQAMNYIEKNYARPISLKEISANVYVTPNYFCKVFKKETKENFIDFLNKYRLEKSKHFLKTKVHLKTYEVAEMAGFSDYKYFAQLFKKHMGISPTEYKNKVSSK